MRPRVLVVGAGAVGGFFGALLYRAGVDVSFFARGATLGALRSRGLTVRSPEFGTFTVTPDATDTIGGLGQPEYVLFCVKTYDLEDAARQIRLLVGSSTVVLPLQNGIDATQRLTSILGNGSVLVGLTYARVTQAAPAIVNHIANSQAIVGTLAGDLTEPVAHVAELLQRAGIVAEARADAPISQWMKFAAFCGAAGLTALTRLPIGPILATPEAAALLADAIQEAVTVGRARGVALPPDAVQRALSVVASFPSAARTSMADDLEAGRRLELDSINGAVDRLGRELGIATPVNRAIYAALKPYIDGSPPTVGQAGDVRATA